MWKVEKKQSNVLWGRKDEAHWIAHSSIRVDQLTRVNHIPDKKSHFQTQTDRLYILKQNNPFAREQFTVTWVDVLGECLWAPQCYRGPPASRHTQQFDCPGQPLHPQCLQLMPVGYLHHNGVIGSITPKTKLFQLKWWKYKTNVELF